MLVNINKYAQISLVNAYIFNISTTMPYIRSVWAENVSMWWLLGNIYK